MKKYSKMIATLPGGVVGIAIAEGVEPILTDVLAQFGVQPVNAWVMVVQAVIIVGVSAGFVWGFPKNAS